ncbi:hypothetical protein GTQ40_03790 [Flavobacteriaceae bacterium R38]|nr:hypothetical protein [Flavobacteriaceae bacterium R38]
MKKKQLNLRKLSLKKSTVAGLKVNQINGGTGTSWNGCQTIPGEPCGFTDFCNTQIGCDPAPTAAGCPQETDGCIPNTVYCATNGALNSCPPPGQYCL